MVAGKVPPAFITVALRRSLFDREEQQMIGTRWRVCGAIATLALAVAVPAGPALADAPGGAVAACTEQLVTLGARTLNFIPPHVNGDTDFAGHGPRVTVRTH